MLSELSPPLFWVEVWVVVVLALSVVREAPDVTVVLVTPAVPVETETEGTTVGTTVVRVLPSVVIMAVAEEVTSGAAVTPVETVCGYWSARSTPCCSCQRHSPRRNQ